MVENNGREKGTTKNRRKQGRSNDAVTGRGLAAPKGKGSSNGNHEDSTYQPVCTGRVASGKFGRKAGGIIRQRRLAIQTQLAFHKEQIRQLEQEDRQLKVLHDEFMKADISNEDVQQFSDEELE